MKWDLALLLMLSILVTTTAGLSRKLKRKNDPKWWKSDKSEKKKIYKKYTGFKFQILEESEEDILIFYCESDKAYDPTVTEVVKKIRPYCSSHTSC